MELVKPTGNPKLDEERRELWTAVLLKGVDQDPTESRYTWAELAVRADEAVAEFDARWLTWSGT